ncbi:MAG TPA: radical SAM family heme chaperone HemW [Bacillota bacterium]|nr:radical SAM family heme chaperone HemW [Bacillota bacterium]
MTTNKKPLGLYIHIPFCARKCRYCDFASYAGCDEQTKEAYVDRLCAELREKAYVYGREYYVDTIFIGGGTPTLLDISVFERITEAVNASFACSLREFSVECNPESAERNKLKALKDIEVTRVSVGVQSLNDDVLRKLGRIHDAQRAVEALRVAGETGLDVNADLMFGLPGQSIEIWKDTLRRTISEKPSHISFYSLQLEEGTPFFDDYRAGFLELPIWEENRRMYREAVAILREAGYLRYEISNAAIEGKQCLHNLKYWRMEDYLGVGAAAHSFVGRRRFSNPSDLNAYLAAKPARREESASGLKGDFIFTCLRLTEGFAESSYRDYFGSAFTDDFGLAAAALKKDGLLSVSGGRVFLTERGVDNTNPVMERLLEVL